MLKHSFFCLSLLLGASWVSSVSAQNSTVDSLKRLLHAEKGVSPQVLAGRQQMLSAYYWRTNPDSAVFYAEKSLAIATSIDDSHLASISKYLKANVLLDKQDGPVARMLYDEAMQVFREKGDTERLMKAMSNYGASYLGENDCANARIWFEKSRRLARQRNDTKVEASILANLGIVADSEGDKYGAIGLYLQALKNYDQIGDRGAAAIIHHNIGAVYSNLEDQQSAIEHGLKACEGYRTVKNLRSLNNALLNLAYYYKELDSLPQANQYLTEVEHASLLLNAAQKSLLLLLKGQVAEKIGDFARATALLDSCIAQARSANSLINLHNGQATLARIFIAQKNYHAALKNALAALGIAQQMNDAVSINLDQKFVAKAYKGLGNAAKALDFLSAYEAGRDTIYTQERFQAIQNIEKKYEAGKKELQIQVQRATIKQQRQWLWSAFGLALLLGALCFTLYRNNAQKKALNRFLNEQNEQLLKANGDFRKKLESAAQRAAPIEDIKNLQVTLSGQNGAVLRLSDILYIEGNDNFVTFHTTNGTHHDWQYVSHYEDLLAASTLFCRTHRSYLVNRLHIAKRRPAQVTMSNGATVAIATTASTKAAVHQWLDQWEVGK